MYVIWQDLCRVSLAKEKERKKERKRKIWREEKKFEEVHPFPLLTAFFFFLRSFGPSSSLLPSASARGKVVSLASLSGCVGRSSSLSRAEQETYSLLPSSCSSQKSLPSFHSPLLVLLLPFSLPSSLSPLLLSLLPSLSPPLPSSSLRCFFSCASSILLLFRLFFSRLSPLLLSPLALFFS